MRRALLGCVAFLRAFGDLCQSGFETTEQLPEVIEFGLLAQNDLVQLIEGVLQMCDHRFEFNHPLVHGIRRRHDVALSFVVPGHLPLIRCLS